MVLRIKQLLLMVSLLGVAIASASSVREHKTTAKHELMLLPIIKMSEASTKGQQVGPQLALNEAKKKPPVPAAKVSNHPQAKPRKSLFDLFSSHQSKPKQTATAQTNLKQKKTIKNAKHKAKQLILHPKSTAHHPVKKVGTKQVAVTKRLVTPQPAVHQGKKHALSTQKIVKIAERGAIASFTYNHKNYPNKLKQASRYFTPGGWRAFSRALKDSKNLELVKQKKITVSAILNGRPKLIKQRFLHGKPVWLVKVPLMVTFKSAAEQLQQNLEVNITLIREAKHINGVAIAQFIANPVQG